MERKKERTETYWPVGVTETHFTCVILKVSSCQDISHLQGAEKEPWFPRPLIQQLDMHMPLLHMDNQQGKLEERFVNQCWSALTGSVIRGELQLNVMSDSLAISDDIAELEASIRTREVALDKELLQLVQGACKADSLARALDLTRLMHNPATVDAAAKVAAFYHLPGLQERILGVKSDVELKRMKEKRIRRSAQNGHSTARDAGPSRGFSDFAPKAAKRSFGGVAPGTERDTTPAMSGRSVETFIPETPEAMRASETPGPDYFDESRRSDSPEGKRKRMETPVDELVVPRKKLEEFPLSNGESCVGGLIADRQAGLRIHLPKSLKRQIRLQDLLWRSLWMRSRARRFSIVLTTSSRVELKVSFLDRHLKVKLNI